MRKFLIIIKQIIHSNCVPILLFVCLISIQCVSNTEKNNTNENSDSKHVENLEYVDLGIGVLWATCNIGADSPEDFGDFYAWGDTSTYYTSYDLKTGNIIWKNSKKDGYNWKNYKFRYGNSSLKKPKVTKYNHYKWGGFVDKKDELELCDDVAYLKRGGQWHTPTALDFVWLVTLCDWEWTERNGVSGYLVTSKREGYVGNSIFLPVTIEGISSNIENGGFSFNYMSSSLSGANMFSDPEDCEVLECKPNGKKANTPGYMYRHLGYMVRPVLTKNELQESKVINKNEENKTIDTTTIAIDNIHLNTTREIFEKEKKTFLANNKKIGDYSIKTVTGLFYKDKLAAVQIISEEQNAHRGSIAINSWRILYYEKYYNISKKDDAIFNYVYKNKGIRVTDYCATNKPFTSFKDFMEQPLEMCYSDEPTYPPHKMENNTDGMFHVSQILTALPKDRANYYREKISVANSRRSSNDIFSTMTPTYQAVYDEARVEANRIIEQRNAANSKKHKNDPSWSVVIIAYMPAVEEYRMEQQEKKKVQEIERQKELEKL